MTFSRLVAVSVLSLGLCTGGHAAAEEPFILGIGTHLMNYPQSPNAPLKLAAEAGLTALKDDAFWSTAQPTPFELRIVPWWRTYLEAAQGEHLSRLIILDYSIGLYDNAKPRGGKVKAGYLDYVDYVVGQLGNRANYYEIWNEWDLEAPHDAKLAADYAALVRDVAPVIRKHTVGQNGEPAKILAGSITPQGMDAGFADRLIEAGVLDHVDGLSIHPYAHCAGDGKNNPESWVNWVREYESHIRAKAGRAVPLYLTEMAWPSHKGNCGNTPETQAAYMARILFFARTIPNIKALWWYDLVNDGPDRTDQEHNFGLLNQDLSPKPAYDVMKAISPFIKDYTYDPDTSVWASTHYQLHFKKGDQQVAVVWAGGNKALMSDVVTHQAEIGHVRLIDTAQPRKGWFDGEQSWACDAQHCKATLSLNGFPKIIRLNPAD